MARRADILGVSGAETVIGAGVVVEGDLTSEGDILIDGTFTGQVQTRGDITLGANAKVTGNLSARNITVTGWLSGNITADGEAAIGNTGHVSGDITCASLSVSSGGVFLGRCKMQDAPTLDYSLDDDTAE